MNNLDHEVLEVMKAHYEDYEQLLRRFDYVKDFYESDKIDIDMFTYRNNLKNVIACAKDLLETIDLLESEHIKYSK